MRRLAFRRRSDDGFTMIELATAMALFGLLAAIAVTGMVSLRNANAEKGTVRELISSLRNVQGRALSEGNTYCVDFGSTSGGTSWNIYRTPGAGTGVLATNFSCTSGTKVAGPEKTESRTSLTSVAFSQRNGTTTGFVLFYPRGAASPGSIGIGRQGSSKTYGVTVDGLTGRVASAGGG